MRKIKFYNEFHLGDNVFHLHYLNNLIRENDEIEFEYFVQPQYIEELNLHIENRDKIIISPLDLIQESKKKESNIEIINSWIGHEKFWYNWSGRTNLIYIDEFYVDWFEHLSKKIEVKNPIKNKMNMLFNNNDILGDSEKYDILFNNSYAMSQQFNNNELFEFDQIIKELAEKFKIITTRKIEGIDCTLDHNMSLIDIGRISKNCQYICGTNNSVIISTMNVYNINNVKYWFVFDHDSSYHFNDRIFQIKTISEFRNKLFLLNL